VLIVMLYKKFVIIGAVVARKVIIVAGWCRWPLFFIINSSGRNSPVSLNFVTETEGKLIFALLACSTG
jgi:hypothetical protein